MTISALGKEEVGGLAGKPKGVTSAPIAFFFPDGSKPGVFNEKKDTVRKKRGKRRGGGES